MEEAGVHTFEWILGHPPDDVQGETAEHPVEHSADDAEDGTPQHAIEDSDVEDSDGEMRKEVANRREAAASRFLHWLGNENGVFHISGNLGRGSRR
jgi:hypothetical protein